MEIKGITLYPEMNAKIKDILRTGNDPVCLYAAARIEQLEIEMEELQKEVERLSKVNQLLPMTLEDAKSDKKRPIWVHLINGWNSRSEEAFYGKQWVVYADLSDYPVPVGLEEKQPRKKFRYRYELEPVFGKPLSEAVREGNFFLICHEAEEEKQQSGLLEE